MTFHLATVCMFLLYNIVFLIMLLNVSNTPFKKLSLSIATPFLVSNGDLIPVFLDRKQLATQLVLIFLAYCIFDQ